MKKTNFFLILLILIVPIVLATSPYMCVSQGLFESVFSGANLTDVLYAPDFRYPNGTSCCGGVGDGVTYTGGANISLAGNVISINKSFAGWDTNAGDDLSLETLDNATVVRSYNTTWVNNLIDARVIEAFLTTILNSVYAPLTILSGLDIVNTSMLQNFSLIRNNNISWIYSAPHTNLSANAIYTLTPHTNATGATADLGALDIFNITMYNNGTTIRGENTSWIYSAPHTNRTDSDIETVMDNSTIIRTGNTTFLKSFDSNASTACSNNEVLLGDGTCYDLGNIQNSTRNRTGNVIYAQLSDLKDQPFAATGTPQPLNFSTEDEIYGLVHSTTVNNSEIIIVTPAIYTMIAQPQVSTGAGGAGTFHMWLEKYDTTKWINISNSNVELVLASNEENVIPLIATLRLEPDEKIRVMGSVSDTAIKLDAQTPTGEPVIPSIIFSMFEVGGTNLSYIENCTGEGSCSLITYDTELDNATIVRNHNVTWITTNQEKNYINNCSTQYSCPDIVYAGNTSFVTTIVNVTDSYWDIITKDLFCTDCLTGTEIAELTDADISNTLTCSNLIASGAVDIGAYSFTAETLISDVATGTAPFTIASTTMVKNLNVSFANYTYNLADKDYGDWACSGGSCTLDGDVVDSAEIATDAIKDDEIDYTTVTLADFPNDINAITNTSDGKLGLLNVTTNLTIHASNIWHNGSGICIGSC